MGVGKLDISHVLGCALAILGQGANQILALQQTHHEDLHLATCDCNADGHQKEDFTSRLTLSLRDPTDNAFLLPFGNGAQT